MEFLMPDDWQKSFIAWRGPLEDNEVWRAIDLAMCAAKSVIERGPNGPRGLAICGASGSGKDYNLVRILKQRQLPVLYLDTSSEAALVHFAWRHRYAQVVLVSDNGKLWQPAKIDRVKHIIDPGRVLYETAAVMANMRRPTRSQHDAMLLAAKTDEEREAIERMDLRDPAIPENDFETHFALIWLSNIDYTDDKMIPLALRPHWQALLSRGINPRFIPSPPRDLFIYALSLVLECSMLRGMHLRLEDANEVLRAFILKRGYLRDVSPRTIRNLAMLRMDLRNSNRLSYWDKELEAGLARTIVNPELAALDVPLFQIPRK
jgi:hypothetical protein